MSTYRGHKAVKWELGYAICVCGVSAPQGTGWPQEPCPSNPNDTPATKGPDMTEAPTKRMSAERLTPEQLDRFRDLASPVSSWTVEALVARCNAITSLLVERSSLSAELEAARGAALEEAAKKIEIWLHSDPVKCHHLAAGIRALKVEP